MKRLFRLAAKKKGSRLTSSPIVGGVGEVIIASLLVLVGLFVGSMVVTFQISTLTGGSPPRWPYFVLQISVALALHLIGWYGILRVLWSAGASKERRQALVSRAREINLLNEVKPVDEDWPSVPVEVAWSLTPGEKLRFQLKPRQKPRWNLIASGILVLIFVAVASILTTMTWNSLLLGSLDVVGAILSVALIVASIWSFRIFVRQLLKITGIGPTRIEVDGFPLYRGGEYELAVVQTGRIRLRVFDLHLNCIEEATFQDGTDLRTESRTVYSERLFRNRGVALSQNSPMEATLRFKIPELAIHSFQTSNNKIQWELAVLCTSRGWPDLRRAFPILVAPLEAERAETSFESVSEEENSNGASANGRAKMESKQ